MLLLELFDTFRNTLDKIYEMDLLILVGFSLLIIAILIFLILQKIIQGRDLKEEEKKSILITPLILKKKKYFIRKIFSYKIKKK